MDSFDEKLFEELRILRMRIARREGIPAYVVCGNKSLEELAIMKPCKLSEIIKVYGFGDNRTRKYGKEFNETISSYLSRNAGKLVAKSAPVRMPEIETNKAVLNVAMPEIGRAVLKNYPEIKSYLESVLESYRNVVYSEEGIKDAKYDKANLNKLKKAIEDKRKEIRRASLEPYKEIEPQFKELVRMINEPLEAIEQFVADMDAVRRDTKCAEIKEYYDSCAIKLGNLSERIFVSPGFYNTKWENASVSAHQWQSDVKARVKNIETDVAELRRISGTYYSAAIEKYLERCSKDDAILYIEKLKSYERENNSIHAAPMTSASSNENRYMTIKIRCNARQKASILEHLDLLGVEFAVTE